MNLATILVAVCKVHPVRSLQALQSARFIGSKAHERFCGAMDSYSVAAFNADGMVICAAISRFGNRRDNAAFLEVYVAPAS